MYAVYGIITLLLKIKILAVLHLMRKVTAHMIRLLLTVNFIDITGWHTLASHHSSLHCMTGCKTQSGGFQHSRVYNWNGTALQRRQASIALSAVDIVRRAGRLCTNAASILQRLQYTSDHTASNSLLPEQTILQSCDSLLRKPVLLNSCAKSGVCCALPFRRSCIGPCRPA